MRIRMKLVVHNSNPLVRLHIYRSFYKWQNSFNIAELREKGTNEREKKLK